MHLILRMVGVGTLLTAAAAGQTATGFQATPSAPEERFVLIQSNRSKGLTLRLDRYSGEVSKLASADGQKVVWVKMPVPGVPKLPLPAKLRFQICIYEDDYTMLFDQATGKVWRLDRTRDEPYFVWEPLGG